LSHLTILPTVLHDADLLAATLVSFGLFPEPQGLLETFGEEPRAVLLRVAFADGLMVGWERAADGSLALVGDLQRLSRSQQLPSLLGRITRAYAARQALAEAAARMPDALIELGA
jgi:hypothetical protein